MIEMIEALALLAVPVPPDPAPAPDCITLAPPPAVAAAPGGASAGGCDGGSVIDVMIVYTALAAADAGGAAAIEAEIGAAIAAANASLDNSLVATSFNLVHVASIDYDEQGTFLEHLQRLTATADGVMDHVHALRDEHAADLVQLLVAAAGQGTCGIAWQMGPANNNEAFAASAFSVVRWECAEGSITTAHEFAHNMGCQHEEGAAGQDPVFPYAYGWSFQGDSGSSWRTVMATTGGTRIPHYSSPAVLYDGQPTGVAGAADNALALGMTAPTVAGFRCRSACPADLDADGSVGITDLLALLAAWGEHVSGPPDLDGDAIVGIGDLLALLASWGPCA